MGLFNYLYDWKSTGLCDGASSFQIKSNYENDTKLLSGWNIFDIKYVMVYIGAYCSCNDLLAKKILFEV